MRKRHLVWGNYQNGAAAMIPAIFDTSKVLEPQLLKFAKDRGLDLDFGVTCVLMAAAVGGPWGAGPA